ncbi:tol-pal system protein YbgF [Psychromonas sp. MB-3u-54]|uniref:tol-pal system protein YbgF n=1 Tax=Psychromonas sp. MB-3u-54 TaxID=2058319 RepID=UPI000C330609|nr:tol-pal system protein YbgF [Psychromonas sp. MB-3u-54]PKH03466.1 tol-pal system protein YbgF [Psychromonas sp. MB-3u-54]
MKKNNLQAAIILATLFSTFAFSAAPVSDVTGAEGGSVEKQLEKFTRLLESRNRMQISMQNQLTQLSKELREIKGGMELFEHKINEIENRQRNLYQLIEQPKAVSTTTTTTTNNTVTATSAGEQSAYQAAKDLVLVNKDFNQAITAFEAFIIDYPQSELLPNSHYWLGLVLYQQKKRKEARVAFLTVSEKFPQSAKRADSLFKIGIIDEYLGELASAKDFYQKVLKEYPNSTAAGLAQKQLDAL